MLAYRHMGAELHYCIATDGALGGASPDDLCARQALAAGRRVEAESAGAMSDATITFLDQPDGALLADADLIARLGEVLAHCKPTLVITHARNDYHADHRALSAAVIQAVGFRVPLLHCDTMMGVAFEPTCYVDTTRWFDDKLAMIRCHQSQDPERFVDMVQLQDRFRAAQCGGGPPGNGQLTYAEAFRFDPVFPFSDIRALLPPPPPVRALQARTRIR